MRRLLTLLTVVVFTGTYLFGQTAPIQKYTNTKADPKEALYELLQLKKAAQSNYISAPKGKVVLLDEGFEDATFPPTGWTTIDADGDTYNWKRGTSTDGANTHTGSGVAYSESWVGPAPGTVLTPDNWLITPQLAITSDIFRLRFWVYAQDQDWPAEHYSVMISTTDNQPASFTEVYSETLTAGPWKQVTVPLSAYNGENIYIAFRHHNSTDMFWINLDDVLVDEIPSNPVFEGAATLAFGNTYDIGVYQKTYQITNAGLADLEVDFVSASPELTITGLSTTINPGSTGTITVTFDPEVAGNYNGQFVLSTNDPNNSTVTVSVTSTVTAAVLKSFLVEDFETVSSGGRPAGWTGTFAVNNTGGIDNSKRLTKNLWSSAPTANITSCFVVMGAAPVLRFYYRIVDYTGYPGTATEATNVNFNVQISSDLGQTYTTVWEYDPNNHVVSTDYAQIEIDLAAFANQNCLFKINGQWINGDFYLDFDNFVFGTEPTDDLAAISITGNTTPTVGIESIYTISVLNVGTDTQDTYTVKLMLEGGIEIASIAGDPIAQGEVKQYQLPWTPAAEGPTYLYGLVEMAGDEALINNQTSNLNVSVQPAGVVTVTIGTAQTFPTVRMPWDFFWKNSLNQTLYLANEINLGGGAITAIAYNNNFVTNLTGKEVRVWIGETSLTDLTSGWVDPATLTLVFDGTLDFPLGENTIVVPFNQPYIYNGGNIVVYSQRVWENQYFSSNDRFYGTEFPNSNRTRRAAADGTVYDPANPPAPTSSQLYHWIPNTTFFFSTAGLGALEGTVTDADTGDSIEGVSVKIIGSSAATTTNAAGFYQFPYLLPGEKEVVFSKQGYFNDTVTLWVVADATTTQDVLLYPIPTYTVSGTVLAGDTNQPVEGAIVKLEGYQNYTDTTDVNGVFAFTGVYGGGLEYAIKVEYPGYQTYTGTVTVDDADITNIQITIIEIPYPVRNVAATITAEENVLVNWKAPGIGGTPQMLMWDNGTNNTSIGTGGAANFDVAHRYTPAILQQLEVGGMSITEVTIWPNQAGATYTLKIWTGGSISGPAQLAYEQPISSPVIGNWTTVTLNTPFTIDDTQELWIGYNINTTTGYPAGCDAGPQVEGFGNMIYFQGTWSTLTQLASSLTYNWNIHAWVDNAKMLDVKLSGIIANNLVSQSAFNLETIKATRASSELKALAVEKPSFTKSAKALIDYSVYRLTEGQPQSEWTQLNANVQDTFYVDNTWNTLDPGMYQYAVVANYTNDVSEPRLSNVLPRAMTVEFVVNISTNSGDPATGAVVTLTNQDGNPDHIYTLTAGATGVTFPAVWRGMYNLEITKNGFDTYTASNLDITDAGSHDATLIETIVAPYGLRVVQQGTNALFSWNNVDNFNDGFESYDNFIYQNIGNYTMVDVDGAASGGIQNVTFPNSEYTGSYIVFNPSATTPALTSEAWQPHTGSKYLACFYSTTPPNNDWLITHPVNVAPGMEFSFWAKSVVSTYGLERFKVGVSNGSTNPNDFTIISGANYIEAPATWTKYTYSLAAYSGQTIRLAIQCVSNDAFVFMVDDLFIGMPTKDDNKAFQGYTVYLDGNQVAEGVTGTSYTFNNVPVGDHTAGVKAVYSSGVSPTQTINFTMVEPQYTVTFIVRNANNAAIAGASIQINNQTLTTNVQGRATINLVNGTYPFTITKTGYNTFSDEVVVASADVEVNVTMTGISETVETTFAVYPNPAGDMITIVRGTTLPAVVEIYNNSGALIKSFEMNDPSQTVTINELSAGVYFIRLIENQNTKIQRFIKK